MVYEGLVVNPFRQERPGSSPVGATGRSPLGSSAPAGPSCRRASAKSPLRIRDVDGNAWIVSASTSTGTCARIARTHSWMAAEASGTGHRRAHQLARRPVDHERHVAQLGLDVYPLALVGVVGDDLEGIDARVAAPSSVSPTETPPGRCRSPSAAPGNRA